MQIALRRFWSSREGKAPDQSSKLLERVVPRSFQKRASLELPLVAIRLRRVRRHFCRHPCCAFMKPILLATDRFLGAFILAPIFFLADLAYRSVDRGL
jgi:hypothetical protein